MQNRRQQNLKKRVLILCEGETEVNYFRGLKYDEQFKRKLSAIDVSIYQPEDFSPFGLVKAAKEKVNEAKRERNSYEYVWVVFDRDQHPMIPDAFDFARKLKIEIAFSMICFEYWILLHFQQTMRAYTKCDGLISDLKSFYPEYAKARNHFEILKDRLQTAITNGKWSVAQNQADLNNGLRPYELSAYTDVHRLVEKLNTF